METECLLPSSQQPAKLSSCDMLRKIHRTFVRVRSC